MAVRLVRCARLGLLAGLLGLAPALAPSQGASFEEADRLRRRGTTNDLSAALQMFESLLADCRSRGDARGEALVLHRIGLVHLARADRETAQPLLERALALQRSHGDRPGQASTLTSLASLLGAHAEHGAALEQHRAALKLWQEEQNPLGQAQALANIGLAHFALADHRRALEHYDRALALMRAQGSRPGEATMLHNLCEAQSAVGDRAAAERSCQEALSLHRALGERAGEAHTLQHLGSLRAASGDWREALTYFGGSLALGRELGGRYLEGRALKLLGDALAALGDEDAAAERYLESIALMRAIQMEGSEAVALVALGRLQRSRGRLHEARARLAEAAAIFEEVRARVADPELRASFFASRRRAHALLEDVLMSLHAAEPHAGHDRAAFETHERSLARGLLDLLGEAGADIREGVPPGLLARERELESRLLAKADRVTRLLSAGADAESVAAARRERDSLIEERRELLSELRSASPVYAALTRPRPASLAQVQAELDEETTLLEYSLGEERSFLWVVTRDGLRGRALAPRAEIEAAALRLYDALTARARGPGAPPSPDTRRESARARLRRVAAADARVPVEARALARLLLPPAGELQGRRLLVVADGALHYVPFAVLPAPGSVGGRAPALLLDRYEIANLTSASSAILLRRRPPRVPARGTLAVLADPVFGADDPRVEAAAGGAGRADELRAAAGEAGVEESGLSGLGRLPFSRREAESALALLPAGRSFAAFDFLASLDTVTSGALGGHRVVHLATHGLLNATRPELSGLVLSLVDERGRPRPGFLRLHHVFNLRLDAEVVVLSGCRTALGKDVSGEGLVGLTRGFMYAGAPRVVASLWSVQDRASAEWMRHFYTALLRHDARPLAALRHAQRSLRADGWQAPFYWAAFTLQGDWR
jgi:CHAT domain-containing protein/tetratricopeptide (TPR) repeat protein